ncbi:hypothetical protein VTI74DRAFT_6007 [Chaetomium olivicolor]
MMILDQDRGETRLEMTVKRTKKLRVGRNAEVYQTLRRRGYTAFCVLDSHWRLEEGPRSGRSRESSQCVPHQRGARIPVLARWRRDLPRQTMHQTIRAPLKQPGVESHFTAAVRGSRALTMQSSLRLGHMVGHLCLARSKAARIPASTVECRRYLVRPARNGSCVIVSNCSMRRPISQPLCLVLSH